jgi:hypothetical protein
VKPNPTSTMPGRNRTGALLHPELAVEMVEGTAEFGPTTRGGPDGIAQVRVHYARDARPVGTMPPLANVPTEHLPILDKLGARLQFERTGTRLYDALISKLDAYGTYDGGPSRDDLLQIRKEEHGHLLLAQELIRGLNGDPTALTPCANLQATASKGICDVLVDPRTNLIECLETILVAELTDLESWQNLVQAVKPLGNELVAQVERAERTEAEHLRKVRAWVAAADRARELLAH